MPEDNDAAALICNSGLLSRRVDVARSAWVDRLRVAAASGNSVCAVISALGLQIRGCGIARHASPVPVIADGGGVGRGRYR